MAQCFFVWSGDQCTDISHCPHECRHTFETQLDSAAENNRRLVGKTQTLLLEEQLDATHWLARSQADAPEVDQTITVASRRKRPAFISATITAAHDCDLEARETPAH